MVEHEAGCMDHDEENPEYDVVGLAGRDAVRRLCTKRGAGKSVGRAYEAEAAVRGGIWGDGAEREVDGLSR